MSVNLRFLFIYGPCIIAALAGLLFGYDVGIISGAQLFIEQSFHTDNQVLGTIVSMVPLGAFIASIGCGYLSDILGRKKLLIITAVLYIIGSLLCAYANIVSELIIGRFILGLAVGLGSFSAPLYIAEISHHRYRGAAVTLNQLAITLGILLSYAICFIFTPTHQWRYMLGIGMIPAVLLLIGVLLLPQSPRWLVKKGMAHYARNVLQKIYTDIDIDSELENIKKMLDTPKMTLSQMLRSRFMSVIFLGIMVSVLTQAVGINAIIYYAPKIFKLAGFSSNAHAISVTVLVGVVNFVFTIITVCVIDKLGRRKMLLNGVAGICLSLLILTVAFYMGIGSSLWLTWICLFAVLFFIACQALSTGPACWLIPSEIFPIKIRGTGMGISVAFNWLTNVIVAYLFPIILGHYGGMTSFAIFLVIAIIAWISFYKYVPETKDISLETIETNLLSGKSFRHLGR